MRDPRLQGLYVITDTPLCAQRGLVRAVAEALAGGARIVQYRDKSPESARRLREAAELRDLCASHDALLIVNDDVQLARAVGAHGVHLGRDDTDVARARRALGADALIGVSCYNDFARARAAESSGADYVAFGSVFPSSTKPAAVRAPLALFARARAELNIPCCAIGGIDADNIDDVVRAGADMAAVISAVFGADDVKTAAETLIRAFHATRRPR